MREDGDEPEEQLAPVIPLFSGRSSTPAAGRAAREAGVSRPAGDTWHTTWTDDAESEFASDPADATRAAAPELAGDRAEAEKALLRKLRMRSLSVAEARAVLTEQGLDAGGREEVLDAFLERRYLDDLALAEQLIHAGVDRKGQGRQVIAQTLAKRGVPRDVADAALSALPDDDAERALEFARSKARSLRSLDRDTALRRLAGQLARRGYGGSAAFAAARTALDEQR